MSHYKLSNSAKEDLIRIHQFGVKTFGVKQADKYFNSFFESFARITKSPNSFEAVDHIKKGYRRCVCGVDSIYFRINDNTVEIIAIIGKQDLLNLK
jgi:toxin ParE1/3/4